MGSVLDYYCLVASPQPHKHTIFSLASRSRLFVLSMFSFYKRLSTSKRGKSPQFSEPVALLYCCCCHFSFCISKVINSSSSAEVKKKNPQINHWDQIDGQINLAASLYKFTFWWREEEEKKPAWNGLCRIDSNRKTNQMHEANEKSWILNDSTTTPDGPLLDPSSAQIMTIEWWKWCVNIYRQTFMRSNVWLKQSFILNDGQQFAEPFNGKLFPLFIGNSVPSPLNKSLKTAIKEHK